MDNPANAVYLRKRWREDRVKYNLELIALYLLKIKSTYAYGMRLDLREIINTDLDDTNIRSALHRLRRKGYAKSSRFKKKTNKPVDFRITPKGMEYFEVGRTVFEDIGSFLSSEDSKV